MNVRNKNLYLFVTAKNACVKNYGKFNNYGYKGCIMEKLLKISQKEKV